MRKICKLFVLLIVIALAVCTLVGCAQPKTVTFKNAGNEVIAVAVADREGRVTEPRITVANGAEIEGWYTDKDFETSSKFEFDRDKIKEDTTLYVKLINIDYNVIYDLGYTLGEGESMPEAPRETIFNVDGTFTTPINAPIRIGYVFKGWASNGNLYEANETVTVNLSGDISLVATWDIAYVTVNFYDDAAIIIASREVPYGSDVIAPQAAAHSYGCFEFVGWDNELKGVIQDANVHAVYEYRPADDSWFDFVPVKNEKDETTAYKIRMALDKESPYYEEGGEYWSNSKKRFNTDGWYGMPDFYNGKPVIGFEGISAMDDVGRGGQWNGYQNLNVSIYIPDSYVSIEKKQIKWWVADTVVVGKNLKSIDKLAFWNCYIQNWIISEENEYFCGEGGSLYSKDKTVLLCMYNDAFVEEVTIPEHVKYIYPNFATSFSFLLKTVNILGDVEEIGAGAFSECWMLSTVNIEGSVKRLADAADCADPNYVNSEDFAEGVFSFCDQLTSINLKGIEYIGFGAFTGCSNLTNIELDTTLKYVSPEALVGLGSLSTIKFNGGATVSTNGKFLCEGNTLIEKEASAIKLTTDGETKGDVFIIYAAMQESISYNIPDTVREFYEWAFEGASKLNSVTIPDGVEELPGGLFVRSGLTSIVIPSSVKKFPLTDESKGAMLIDSVSAFINCRQLASITFAEDCQITEIPDLCFNGTILTVIELPASVIKIAANGLAIDTLQAITVQNGSVNFEANEGVLYNLGKMELLCYPASKEGETFEMPSSVRKIMRESFASCHKLVRLEINEGFEEILPGAFYGARLKEIVFSSTVKKVDLCSFPCYYLELLDFSAMTDPFEVTNILEAPESTKLFMCLTYPSSK